MGSQPSASFVPIPHAGAMRQSASMQTGVPMQFVAEGATMQPMMCISSDKGNMWVPAVAYYTVPGFGPLCTPQIPNQYVSEADSAEARTRPSRFGRENGVKGSRRHTPILPSPVKPMPEVVGEPRTTVMLRNMPNNYSRAMLLE